MCLWRLEPGRVMLLAFSLSGNWNSPRRSLSFRLLQPSVKCAEMFKTWHETPYLLLFFCHKETPPHINTHLSSEPPDASHREQTQWTVWCSLLTTFMDYNNTRPHLTQKQAHRQDLISFNKYFGHKMTKRAEMEEY